MAGDVVFKFDADVTALLDKVRKGTKVTTAELKKIKQAGEGAEEALDDATKAGERLVQANRKLQDQVKRTSEAFRSGKEAAGVFGGRVGAAAEALDKARNASVAALTAIGPVGVAGVAAGLGIGVLAAGSVALTIALIEGLAAAEVWADEIEGMGIIADDAAEPIREFNDALEKTEAVAKAAAVVAGSELSVELIAVAEASGVVLLVVLDLVEGYLKLRRAIIDTATAASDYIGPQNKVAQAIRETLPWTVALDKALGLYSDTLDDIDTNPLIEDTRTLTELMQGLQKDAAEAGKVTATFAKDFARATKEMEAALDKIRFKRGIMEEEEQEQAQKALNLMDARADAAILFAGREEAAAQRRLDTITAADRAIDNINREVFENRKAREEAIVSVTKTGLNTLTNSFETFASIRLQQLQSEGDASKESILKAFNAQQNARRAGVLLENVEFFARLTTFLAPFSGPAAPFIAGGIAGAQLFTNLAAIDAVPAPTFPTGRGPTMSSSPDHELVGVQPTEGILTPRGVAEAGGAQGIDAMNRGMPMTQTVIVQMDGVDIARGVANSPGAARILAKTLAPHLKGTF